jgi:serine/threonine-protein phosphatase PGAM5
MCAALSPQGTRTLILIRHGDYDDQDPRDAEVGRALVPLGREQARLAGVRLAALPARIDALYASTMTRARETAEIIAASLPGLRPELVRDLRECTPPTWRQDIARRLEPGEADSCRAQIERAFARFFVPAPGEDRQEVLVCHGNVIRWFCCRALGVDPMAWGGMTIANCSLTIIRVLPDGALRLVSFDDVGHIPPALQTYTGQKRPPRAPADSAAAPAAGARR